MTRPSESLTRDQLLEMYYFARLARSIEERLVLLFRQSKVVGGLYRSVGQEGESVATAYALDRTDAILPLIRNMGALTTMGVRPREIFLQYMAKADSNSRGRDLNIHIVNLPRDGEDGPVIVGPISMLGDSIPVAAGIAMGARMARANGSQRKPLVAMAWIGDGATSTGAFHEGLNFAAVQKAPLVVVAEDNKYAYSTPISKQMAIARIDERAAAYGIPHEMVDGNDMLAVYDVAKRMVDRARAGEGASLVGVDTMRMQGHAQHDDARYVPKTLMDEWAKRGSDCAVPRPPDRALPRDATGPGRHRRHVQDLRSRGGGPRGRIADAGSVHRRARRLRRRRLRGAADRVRQVAVLDQLTCMAVITYLEAIRQALFDEMARDERVFVLGEDVGAYGGAFKVTEGLQERFGEERVIDTPISETAIVGSAIGASYMGMRPVAEVQFIDFIACCFDMLTNFAATSRYRNGAGVPIVVRGPCGGGVSGGPFHSLNPESFFLNTPGLKMVEPSTAYDAKGLLKAAIRDDDPVLYFEHKYPLPPDQGRRARRRLRGADRQGCREAGGTRPLDHHVRRDGSHRARGGIDARPATAWRLKCSTCGAWRRSIAKPSSRACRRRAASSCCTRRRAPAGSAGSWRRSSRKRRSGTWTHR